MAPGIYIWSSSLLVNKERRASWTCVCLWMLPGGVCKQNDVDRTIRGVTLLTADRLPATLINSRCVHLIQLAVHVHPQL